MDFSEELKEKSSEINKLILSYLPKEEGFQNTILKACNYSVINGGKRLRPILMESAYLLVKGPDEKGFYRMTEKDSEILGPFMAAMEMIHSSSLVHDDLPCMDNDTLRRGKPSTWAAFGEDMGTLAGDGLMIFAFETAFKSKASPDLVLKAAKVLSEKTGIFGMIGGQTVDVELTGKKVSKDQLEFIYKNKTGALIEGSVIIGALLAGADEKTIDILSEAALETGMAFQIKDDILDVTATEEELGKPIGSDEEQKKDTWLTYHGMEESLQAVADYTKMAVEKIESVGDYGFVKKLLISLIDRKY